MVKLSRTSFALRAFSLTASLAVPGAGDAAAGLVAALRTGLGAGAAFLATFAGSAFAAGVARAAGAAVFTGAAFFTAGFGALFTAGFAAALAAGLAVAAVVVFFTAAGLRIVGSSG
jgi:hypothetical protein